MTPVRRRVSKTALLAILGTILLWGAHGPVAKILVDALPWPEVVAINNGLAVAFLALFCALTGRLAHLRRYTLKQYAQLSLAGACGVFAYYALLLYSFSTKAEALEFQVLNYLFPVMTVIFSAALVAGERLTVRRMASVLIAFFGAYWVLSRGHLTAFTLSEWRGDLAAFGAAVSYGLFTALGKRFTYERFTGMLVFFAAGGILSTALMLTLAARGLALKPPAWQAWFGLAFIGIASNCLGAITWFRAVRAGDTALMGSLVYLTLFASIGFFYLLRHEAAPASTFIGSVFVVAGAALASRQSAGTTAALTGNLHS